MPRLATLRNFTFGIASLGFLASCQVTGGTGTSDASVTRSGPAPSVSRLSFNGLGNCQVGLKGVPAPWLLIDPKEEYYGATSDPMSKSLDGYADAVGRLAAAAFRSDAAKEQLRSAIIGWARSNAMQWPSGWNNGPDSGPATVFFTTHTMVPVAVAYGEHRELFSLEEQAVVESWMKRLVDRTGNNEQMSRWSVDNKGYLWASFAMTYGIIAEDQSYVRRATRIYQGAIRAMRSDGSLPNDSGRGGSAIHYTNKAIASLVLTAELAAGQGVDLYGYSAGGKTIHTAIDFLLRATQQPSLIAGYAAEDTGASFRGFDANNQKVDWVRTPSASWGLFYAKRFPQMATTQQLRRVSSYVRSPRAEVDAPSAGVARCLA